MTTYKYRGFEFEIDDSKGCYLEVTYQDVTGYAGINLKGTPATPYAWWMSANVVTEDGLAVDNSSGDTMDSNLNAVCDWIIEEQTKREGQHAFDQKAREQACDALHVFVKELDT